MLCQDVFPPQAATIVGDLGAGEKSAGTPAQEGFDKAKVQRFLKTGGMFFLVHHGLLYRIRASITYQIGKVYSPKYCR
jgi:hypothetical protein